jgi:Spy/CpxP family protein refolding chaperone
MNQVLRRSAVLILSLAAVATAVGCGHPPAGPFGGGPFGGAGMPEMIADKIDGILDELQATPEQRDRIRAILDDLHQEIEGRKGEPLAFLDQLFTELKRDNPDAPKLSALLDGQIDQVRGLAHKVLDSVLQVREVLTPAQREQVSAKIEEHRNKFKSHIQKMRGRFCDR